LGGGQFLPPLATRRMAGMACLARRTTGSGEDEVANLRPSLGIALVSCAAALCVAAPSYLQRAYRRGNDISARCKQRDEYHGGRAKREAGGAGDRCHAMRPRPSPPSPARDSPDSCMQSVSVKNIEGQDSNIANNDTYEQKEEGRRNSCCNRQAHSPLPMCLNNILYRPISCCLVTWAGGSLPISLQNMHNAYQDITALLLRYGANAPYYRTSAHCTGGRGASSNVHRRYATACAQHLTTAFR